MSDNDKLIKKEFENMTKMDQRFVMQIIKSLGKGNTNIISRVRWIINYIKTHQLNT